MRFDELTLHDCLHEAVESFGFDELTKIQEETFLPVVDGHDIMACSQTGSGKTVAFLLPIMERMLRFPKNGIRALIIAPTRELCLQIEEQIEGLAYFSNQSSIAIYGGNDQQGFGDQKNALVNGVDIVVATPGRLISHLNLGYADFSTLDFLVLDEADEMLDMGFYPDIMKIVAQLPKKRQSLMFSATMPPQIKKLAEQILVEPKFVDLNFSKPAAEIDQKVYMVYEKDKMKLLLRTLAEHNGEKVIIFVGKKQSVGEISSFLRMNGLLNRPINSNFTQEERENAVLDFKSGKTSIIVTTNLLSRGIDIDNVNLILNYDIPHKAEDYVHRIGRTARAGKDGLAISFIGEKEVEHFARIEKLLERVVEKSPLPEGFGEAPEYAPGKKPLRRRRGGSRSHRGGRKFSGQRKSAQQKVEGASTEAKPRRPHRRRRPNKEAVQN